MKKKGSWFLVPGSWLAVGSRETRDATALDARSCCSVGRLGRSGVCRSCFALCLAFFALVPSPARAESAGSLVDKGNEAYQAGKYEEALSDYEKAAEAAPESPEVRFNRGAALYMKGDHDSATDSFKDTLNRGKADRSLEAKSLYNLGNSAYRRSEKIRDSDPEKSLGHLQDSVGCYRRALELDETLADAARNIEVARLTMKQIQEEQKQKQEQSQQQQEQQQKAADKLKDLLQKQQQAAEKNQQTSQEQKQQTALPQENQQKMDELAQEQKALQNETRETAQGMKEAGQQSEQMKRAAERVEEASKDQQKASEKLEKRELDSALGDQQKAAEELKKAIEELGGEEKKQEQKQEKKEEKGDQQKGDQQKQDQNQEPQDQKQGEEGEKGEEMKPLQDEASDILDEEKKMQEQRQTRMMMEIKPVEKDW